MNRILFTSMFLTLSTLLFAQKNFIDQPYVETTAKSDTSIVPDRIFITIILDEADTKNKKSVEELEKILDASLKKLGIDTEKDLSLGDFASNFKNYFLKGQNILKSKMYSLMVRNAITAGKIMSELENKEISNVSIERTEYSKEEELLLELKSKAAEKTKLIAQSLAKPLNQKVCKALYLSDASDDSSFSNPLQGRVAGVSIRGKSTMNKSNNENPFSTEFKKIKYEVIVNAIYTLE
jgi:uncharacterized protein